MGCFKYKEKQLPPKRICARSIHFESHKWFQRFNQSFLQCLYLEFFLNVIIVND